MRILTSYYGQVKNLLKQGITPVGISVQIPKWFEGESIRDLAPSYDMLKMEKEEYDKRFQKILDKVDFDYLMNELRMMGDGGDVALLCYEGLHKEGEWCHRTMVSEWLKEKGIEVEEFKS